MDVNDKYVQKSVEKRQPTLQSQCIRHCSGWDDMWLVEQCHVNCDIILGYFWGIAYYQRRYIYMYYVCLSHPLLLRSIFPLKQELRTARVFRKHFWCSSTFRTKSLHIYHVCFCQHIVAMVDISYRARTENRTRYKKGEPHAFWESISVVLPHLEQRIYT